MTQKLAGYREIEHTADWALKVWAPDLNALFEQAAAGMYALMEASLQPGSRQVHELSLQAADSETLLVSFLEELLYHTEQHDIGFERIEVEINELTLTARLWAAPILSRRKEIKAVTFSNLEIRQAEDGVTTQIVFDV